MLQQVGFQHEYSSFYSNQVTGEIDNQKAGLRKETLKQKTQILTVWPSDCASQCTAMRKIVLVFRACKGCWYEWDQLRTMLTEAPVLALPRPSRPFIMDTDASNVGIGAVLAQKGEDRERAVAYFIRSLSKPQRNYCVDRRELLAVVEALRPFRRYLYWKRFLLRTDRASLNFKEPRRSGGLVDWSTTGLWLWDPAPGGPTPQRSWHLLSQRTCEVF